MLQVIFCHQPRSVEWGVRWHYSGIQVCHHINMSYCYYLRMFINVHKCQNHFTEKYRKAPHNVIIKHVDRRIRGKDIMGNITVSNDFSATYYYHLIPNMSNERTLYSIKFFTLLILLIRRQTIGVYPRRQPNYKVLRLDFKWYGTLTQRKVKK